jgi:hypothetical protein
MASNPARARAWRDRVLLCFHSHGFYGAHAVPDNRHVPLFDRRPHGDVQGLPGWTLATRNQRGLNLAVAMAEVESEAKAEGNVRYASVQIKPGYPTTAAYVTLPLSVFMSVLAELHPETVGHPNLREHATA